MTSISRIPNASDDHPVASDASPAASSVCDAVSELLPWFLNGSLAAEEQGLCTAHLGSCGSCRSELESTLAIWDLVTVHAPAGDLAAYALGLETVEWERSQVENHLASCATCCSEVEGIQAAEEARSARQLEAGRDSVVVETSPICAPVVSFPAGGTPHQIRPMSTWAVAAALVLTALLGFLSGRGLEFDSVSPQSAVASTVETLDQRAQAEDGVVLRTDGFETGSMGGWSLVNSDAPDHLERASGGASSESSDNRS